MGVWILMLCVNLILPPIMLCFGFLWIKKPPTAINSVYGYRTKMSMKNEETWAFAHKHSGRLMRVLGVATFVFAVVIMLFVISSDETTIIFLGVAVQFLPIILLCVSIGLTQRALRQEFDEDGNRR